MIFPPGASEWSVDSFNHPCWCSSIKVTTCCSYWIMPGEHWEIHFLEYVCIDCFLWQKYIGNFCWTPPRRKRSCLFSSSKKSNKKENISRCIMEAEESVAESDHSSYFNQSEMWPEEVQEVNTKFNYRYIIKTCTYFMKTYPFLWA